MNIYQTITDEIITAIEAQTAGDFIMPWHRFGAVPQNAVTGASYRGINILSLEASRIKRKLTSSYWASFKQWQEAGASVRKGEKGTLIVFYKSFTVQDKEGENKETESDATETESATAGKQVVAVRHSYVFNAEQVEGWTEPPSILPDLTTRLAAADAFIGSTGADIREGGSRAYYSVTGDYIGIPVRTLFKEEGGRTATEAYYGTLLHELIHWTGSASRCHRSMEGGFGSESYASEELVAELGAAFLCSKLGISPVVRPDHAAYLSSWLKALKNDSKALFRASAQATKAVEFLEGLQRNLVREGLSDQTSTLLQGLALNQSRE